MNCPLCGAAAGAAVTCPACGHYLYVRQVEELMRRALAAERENQPREAGRCWERLLPLLPPGSSQRPRIERRLAQLRGLMRPAAAGGGQAERALAAIRQVTPPGVPGQPVPVAASVAARPRWLVPVAAAGALLLALMLAAGWQFGSKLVVALMLRAEQGADDPRLAVAAALLAHDWPQAQQLLAAGRNEPWVAEGRLAFAVLRSPGELQERFRNERQPDELNRMLALKRQPVWAELAAAVDSAAAQALAERLTALRRRQERLPASPAPEHETQVAGVWQEVMQELEYCTAITAERYPPAAAAVRQMTVWRDEVAPLMMHVWLENVPSPSPAAGWNEAAATAALARMESALAARVPGQWLAADRERAVAALRALVLALGDSAGELPAASRATYADAVAQPVRVTAGTVVDWSGVLLACEPAPGGQPFRFDVGGTAVTGDYRLQLQLAGSDSGAVRVALALFTGALPAEVVRAAGVRVIATLAGVTPWTDAHNVMRSVPLLQIQRLVLPDGTVFAPGNSGPLLPGARARQLLLRLTAAPAVPPA